NMKNIYKLQKKKIIYEQNSFDNARIWKRIKRNLYMMFIRFTERAQKVLALSQEEATRLGHNNIGTEHILLGLIREGEGIAAKALNELGLEVKQIQEEVGK